MLGILAKKAGMTQVFDEEGNAIPVSVLEILENVVTQIKTIDKDGYDALQIAALETKESRLSRPELQHLRKAGSEKSYRHLQEFRDTAENCGRYTLASTLPVREILGEDGELVDLQGEVIGKGTMGRIQRHNGSRRFMSHGAKHHRHIGSAGPGTDPGRVFKGTRMAGRENHLITICKLTLVKYDEELNALLIRGAVPGYNGAILSVRPSKKRRGWNKHARDIRKAPALATV